MENYDVVIIGAGPAGLFMAKELSKDFSVCVIEKNNVGETSKFWVVSNKNVRDNRLEDCVICRPKECVYRNYLGNEFGGKIKEGNPIIDEHKVLEKWAKEAKKKKVTFHEKTIFQKFNYNRGGVKVSTSKGILQARLLIDASGESSKIAKKYGMVKIIGYHSTYGGLYENLNIDNPDKIVMWDYLKKSKPIKLWLIYPLSKSKAYTLIYLTSSKKYPIDKLKRYFKDYIKKVSYLPRMMKNAKLLESKFGYIPLYERKKAAINRVLILGDAAGLDPPCFGGGFYIVLSLYKKFAERIKEKLKENKLNSLNLQQCVKLPEIYQDNFLFQEILSYAMRNPDKEELFLKGMEVLSNRFNSRQEAKLLFSKAEPKILAKLISSLIFSYSLEEIFKLLPKENIPLFIELCTRLLEDSFVEEAYEIFNKKYPKK